MTTDEAIDLCKHNSEAWATRAARNGDAEDAADAEAIRVILAENARLAARVADLEAERDGLAAEVLGLSRALQQSEAWLDRAERLAAVLADVWFQSPGFRPRPSHSMSMHRYIDDWNANDIELAWLAAVRAVTRAATTGEVPQGEQGEGER